MPTDTFNYTGAEQTFDVPPGLTSVYWELWGGGGEDGTTAGTGQPGGRVAGDLPVTGDETLRVYVGGGDGNTFNGGGSGPQEAGHGGGATDVRQGGNTLSDREIVAAGGGGGSKASDGSGVNGGQGGADTGEDGDDFEDQSDGGHGGTQSAGGAGGDVDGEDGSLGEGGNGGITDNDDAAGGGGGGGYYGGGGGGGKSGFSSAHESGGGGGGGSNLDDGFSTVDANERGTGNSGNGKAEVTYADNNPENLTASTAGPDSIDLGWDAPSSNDVETPDRYNIYRSTSAGVTTSDTLAGSTPDGTTTTFTDTGLDENTEYFYIVVADFPNGGEGDASGEDSDTTDVEAPSNLTEVAHDTDSIDVSWTDESDAEDGYRAYYSTDGGSSWTQHGSDLAANTTSYTYDSLRNGEEYTLEVRAFGTNGEFASNEITVTTDLPDVGQPTLDASTEDEFGVSWTDVINYGDYRVAFRATGASTWLDALSGRSTVDAADSLTNWSGDTNISLATVDDPSQDGTAVQATLQDNGGGSADDDITLDLSGSPQDWSSKTHFQFWFQTDSDADFDLYIHDGSNSHTEDSVVSGPHTGLVQVALSPYESAGVDLSSVEGVLFRPGGTQSFGETYHFDSVIVGSDTVGQATTSVTIVHLKDGEEYEVRMRTETEHATGAWTTPVDDVTVLPVPTNVAASPGEQDWFETLSDQDISWTDESDNETGFRVQLDDGSGFSTVATKSANVESHTISKGDLDYNSSYSVRVEVFTEHTTALSSAVNITTPLLDVPNQEGYWMALIGGDAPADRQAITDDILGNSIDFAREHTALSDFTTSVAYDETLESETFSECHLYFDSEHLFAGEIQRIESNERDAKTTISGPGAPGATLERGEASVRYQNELAWEALQDYLDNHANLDGTVTDPTGNASTVDGEEIQSADTTAEFNGILPAGEPEASDPWEVDSGSVKVLQTLFFSEGEDFDADNNSAANTQTLGDDPSQGEARQIENSGDWIEWDFNIDHVIPAAEVGFWVRNATQGADSPGVDWKINGETVRSLNQGVMDLTYSWQDRNIDGVSSDLDPADNPHTLRVEATASGTDGYVVDCVALADNGSDDRFTPNYNFDNSVDANDNLSGPEPIPESVRVPFAQESTPYRITAVSIDATLNDTTGSQAIGWSVDDGSTWNDSDNTDTVNDDAVSTPATAVTGSVVLGRTNDTRSTQSPTSGYNGQELQDWSLKIDGDTVGVIVDERVTHDHLTNIQRLAKRAGVRFYLNHDPDEANWTVEAFAEGDRSDTADWATKDRTRTVDVAGYANRVVVRGALKDDGTGERYEADVSDDSEIAAFGKEIKRTFTDQSLTSTEAARSEARRRLDNAIDEDSLTGLIDIMPVALNPGVTYTISAWSVDQSLERLTYRVSMGEAIGQLHFATPGGLGDAVTDVEQQTRTIGDAV